MTVGNGSQRLSSRTHDELELNLSDIPACAPP